MKTAVTAKRTGADGAMLGKGVPESLEDAVRRTLEEARMVIPGMQALFGFQLIVVFNGGFAAALSRQEQWAHLAALVLVGVSIALAMGPAAYHRQAEPGQVSAHLLRVASTLISAALVPLTLGLCVDIYLVARVITEDPRASGVITALFFAVIAGLWFVYPQWSRIRQHPS